MQIVPDTTRSKSVSGRIIHTCDINQLPQCPAVRDVRRSLMPPSIIAATLTSVYTRNYLTEAIRRAKS